MNQRPDRRPRRRYRMTRMLLPPLCGLLLSLAPVIASRADDLPLPPVPPFPAPNTETAPVPNRDAFAPLAPLSQAPNLNLKLYRSEPPDPSMGFSPGSRYQSSEDRKAIQTPGLSLSVPLR